MSQQQQKSGITGYGAYIPRLRMSREAIAKANAWFAPGLRGKAKGERALANWDEDSLTMAVAAARDLLGSDKDRSKISDVVFASTTPPFADRLNAGVISQALNLGATVSALDTSGSLNAGLAGFSQALKTVSGEGECLLAASDSRITRAASPQEMDYGDAAAAFTLGTENLVAEVLGEASITADFVDHFRATGEDIDYHWEERWVRDEGISKLLPQAVGAALESAGVDAAEVNHFIFPSTFKKADTSVAKKCGINESAVVDNMALQIGDSGAAHGLLMLAATLETAEPGQLIVVAGFGSGARAMVLKTTDLVQKFAPKRGVANWLVRGTTEENYTRLLAYKGQLELERGMRGEQDKKTALSTSWRHHEALLGLVAGKSKTTGTVHFPPSRISLATGSQTGDQDDQEPYPLAERKGKVMSWSAEYLSFYMAPPHHYGQIDFEGGGRILMEFTDVQPGEVQTGSTVEMAFRVKDIDDRRSFKRYFWKAVPLLETNQEEK